MPNRKLLLADDSVTIQKVINLTFADEGIEVLAVGDGDTAMERLVDFRPDIVLADVNMPGLNGYRICETLRRREETSRVPVILLVGSFEAFDEDEARRVGASDWMTKPFQSIRQLVNKVSALLDPKEEQTAAVPDVVTTETAMPVASEFVPMRENEDIEDLYTQSFTEKEEIREDLSHDHILSHPGMDDDMIETSYAPSPAVVSPVREFELKPVEVSPVEPEILPEVRHEAPPEIRVAEQPDMLSDRGDERYEVETAGTDETLHDLETLPAIEYQPVHETTANFDTIPRFEVPAPQPPSGEDLELDEKGFAFESGQAEIVTEPVPENNSHSFEESDPLEIPVSSSVPTFELGPEDNIVTLDETPKPEQFSPEFIDAVARKVIEKISENVIRQIAWQIVPQVAESVLRDKNGQSHDQG